ncbi:hypothetical protein KIW84_052787 [Lathyrus oleraceus]|uniref:DUF7745 domain-containing protein n=1 Tax=Pisum sativum TaxID=3888 RepID=A0A9D5AHW9_PEA|nr:hypothetical protein KIW84_052787 [Pisum sativum]
MRSNDPDLNWQWATTGATFFSGELPNSGQIFRFSNLHHFARSLYQNEAGVMYITPKYQLENKLEFWKFELDSLLALPKQKINELKDEGLEALDPRIQPDIIDSCGEFSNVPLLGTCGGINYNPILARRRLGFPLKDKPNNVMLEGVFFQEGKDPQNLKGRMVHAWCKVHRKGRKELGPKNCIALEPYTSWVRKTTFEYRMPHDYPRPTPMVMVGPSTLPNQGVEELRDEDHSRAWVREREELLQQLRDKDALIEFLEHQVIDEPDDVVTSLLPQSSKFWKRRYDRLAKKKADMEAAYEREVKRLRAAYLPVSRALDNCF